MSDASHLQPDGRQQFHDPDSDPAQTNQDKPGQKVLTVLVPNLE